MIQAVPSIIYTLFAGSWSDRHGRKLLIICCLFGYVICNAVFLINLYFFYELKAEYLLFECLQGIKLLFEYVVRNIKTLLNKTVLICLRIYLSISMHYSLDLTGGSTVFYLASYSYISDVSNPKTRTKRFAYLDGVFPLGFYIGNSLSGIIKKRLGFYYNFGLGMLFATLAVLYCIFFVQDSRIIRDERIRKQRAQEMQDISSNNEKFLGNFGIATHFVFLLRLYILKDNIILLFL